MRLYDTARRGVVPFAPGRAVTMYVCGITPYDATHMGHAATYLTYDVLVRRLRDRGHETRVVRNVTDVDDDILRRAGELGMDYRDLARTTVEQFDSDMDWLGVVPVDSAPWASSAIDEILAVVGELVGKGHAYPSQGSVYFSVSSAPAFGRLSGLGREEMMTLAAERGGNPTDPAKADPLDFVLWQRSEPDEPAWDSPWGRGRPGWHIECSALAVRELGPTIDLHGGGRDLVFPHHECEVVQTESATGKPFVGHWMHTAMVGLDGEKMSKSRGNLVKVAELRQGWRPAEVRLALLDHHYRHDWEWSSALLYRARERLEAWSAAGPGNAGLDDVGRALDEDLDVPAAMAVIDRKAQAGERGGGVGAAAALLGVELS